MSERQHRFIRANGLTFHVVEEGSGPPILFLHGFPEFWYCWRHVMRALGREFRAIAIDTRGVGESEGPAAVEGYRVKHLVADVIALIEALALERPILVGHDWGGFVAWATAIRFPERLSRLVVLNAAHPAIFDALLRTDARQQGASRYMLAFRSARGEELLQRGDYASFRENILDPLRAAGHFTESDVAAYRQAWSRPGALTAGLNYYRANKAGPPSGDDAPPIAVADTIVRLPTLVLWGERDPYFVLENVERLGEVAPDLRLVRFPEHDHWIVHQAPERVAVEIAAFAAAKGPSRAP